jgi:Cu/Ag efflux protein CusF
MRKLIPCLILGSVLALSFIGCGETKPASPAPAMTSSQRYELRGAVISVDAPAKEAIIQHEKIQDLMDAMRMGFSVPNADDLAKLQPGKAIKATLVVENNMMWLESVEVTGEAPASAMGDTQSGGHAH